MSRWSMIRQSMVEGTENRFEGVIFVIEMIKLSYLGLIDSRPTSMKARTCMCHKILKSCCIGQVEFIHKNIIP